jgi:hypothetical protein
MRCANEKTPLNFLCRSNSGAGTEKRPLSDSDDTNVESREVKKKK